MNDNIFLGDELNPVLDEVNSSAEKHRKRGVSAVCRRIYEQLQQNGVTWDEFVAEVSSIEAEPSTREKLVKFRAERLSVSEEVVALQPEELPESVVGSVKNVNRKIRFAGKPPTDAPEHDGEGSIKPDGRTNKQAQGQEKGEE